MAILVYLLCAGTSFACAVLLLRGYRRTRARLLLWSGCCFVGLFLNNLILIVGMTPLIGGDLRVARLVPAVVGVCLLLYGLVWESAS